MGNHVAGFTGSGASADRCRKAVGDDVTKLCVHRHVCAGVFAIDRTKLGGMTMVRYGSSVKTRGEGLG